MNNSQLTIYENLQSNFRLTVNMMFKRENQQTGTTHDNVFINKNNGQGSFRPSCFLVFTYLTDDFNTTKGIYTSVPHIAKIRSSFARVAEMLTNPQTFINVNGMMTVNQNVETSVLIDQLSKQDDWISLSVVMSNNTMTNTVKPSVALQHSKANGYSSILDIDEFMVVNDIIQHIDYVTLLNQAVMIEMIDRVNSCYNQGATKQTPRPQMNYGYTAPKPVMTQPSYQQYPYNNQKVEMPQTHAPRPAMPQQYTYNNQKVEDPQMSSTPTPKPATQYAKPEPKKPMMTMDELNNIEVDTESLSLDEDSAINEIFG